MAPADPRAAVVGALAAEPRASVESLARTTGLGSATVRHVLAELPRQGITVQGIVHPAVFGLHAYAHVLVRPSGSITAALGALEARADVPFTTRTAGRGAIAAELRVRDRRTLAERVAELRALPAVADVVVDEYVDIVKDAMVVLRPLGALSLDDVDLALLGELQHDGRRPYAALAKEVALSTAATRARVLRLVETGAVHVGLRRRPGPDVVQVGFRLSSTGAPGAARQAVCALPEVSYLATALGDAELVGTLTCSTLRGAGEALDRLARVAGVAALETWTHLEVTKERYDHSARAAAPPVPSDPTGPAADG